MHEPDLFAIKFMVPMKQFKNLRLRTVTIYQRKSLEQFLNSILPHSTRKPKILNICFDELPQELTQRVKDQIVLLKAAFKDSAISVCF